jgi:hypothetical protein
MMVSPEHALLEAQVLARASSRGKQAWSYAQTLRRAGLPELAAGLELEIAHDCGIAVNRRALAEQLAPGPPPSWLDRVAEALAWPRRAQPTPPARIY